MNRPVLAVPGPVTSPASAGCHRMIRDGEAILVESAADVLEFLDLSRGLREPAAYRSDPRDRLSTADRQVLDAMPSRRVVSADTVAAAAGLPLAAVWSALGALEVGGWVSQETSGWRLARLTDVAQAH